MNAGGEAMSKRNPILLAGSGRSGTNWLLNLLDLHPDTHCRNEPDAILDSLVRRMAYSHAGPPLELEDVWDEALDEAAMSVGFRDRAPQRAKNHMHAWSFAIGLAQLSYRKGVREAIGPIYPSLGRQHWRLPWWVGSRKRLENAIPVFKFAGPHRWIEWALENRPGAKVVHMVRHPGGVMNSWKTRYLATHDPAKVLEENVLRLEEIARFCPDWAERFGDIRSMKVMEAEVWNWAYATTVLHGLGEGMPAYYCLLYEDLIADQVNQLRRIYEACALEWRDDIAEALDARSGADEKRYWSDKVVASGSIAKGWKEKLTDEERGFVERALAASVCADWWDEPA